MVPWSLTQTEAFAGLHNLEKRLLLVFDEASAIPDLIWEVTEGSLIDRGTEIVWVVFSVIFIFFELFQGLDELRFDRQCIRWARHPVQRAQNLPALSQLRTGKIKNPQLHTLREICRFFHVPLRYFETTSVEECYAILAGKQEDEGAAHGDSPGKSPSGAGDGPQIFI